MGHEPAGRTRVAGIEPEGGVRGQGLLSSSTRGDTYLPFHRFLQCQLYCLIFLNEVHILAVSLYYLEEWSWVTLQPALHLPGPGLSPSCEPAHRPDPELSLFFQLLLGSGVGTVRLYDE